MEEFEKASCIRGFHVYQDNWTPILGERLVCKNEPDNPRDRYAVAVCKAGDEIVGHLPRNISTMCSIFIRRGGIINCTVSGRRQYSRDLPQGGMEIPCTLHFAGNERELKKVEQFFSSIPSILATTQPQPSVSGTQPAVSGTQAAVSDTQPSLSGTQPAVSGTQAAVNITQPSVNITQPAVSNTQLRMKTVEDSSMESEIPVGASTQPVLSIYPETVTDNNVIVLADQSPSDYSSEQSVWVTFERCVLYTTDKLLIENGSELTDKHIHFAQSIIKSQYPSLGGLHSTLLQEKPYLRGCRTANTIQIVYCKKRRHWVTVSTKWCNGDEVAVYDSLFTRLDAETRATIMKMFGLKRARVIVMMPMQQQDGSTDCGVFAIATMTSLALDEDPSGITYKQVELRHHLLKCISEGKLTYFPRELKA